MDNFEEIRKYKMLLDEGAISQDEFDLLKQRLLGLEASVEEDTESEQFVTESSDESVDSVIDVQEDDIFVIEEADRFQEEECLQEELYTEQVDKMSVDDMQLKKKKLNDRQNRDESMRSNHAEDNDIPMTERVEITENNTNGNKSIKSIISLVLSWIFTVFFGLGGVIYLFDSESPFQGVCLLIIAALLLPPLTRAIKKKWKHYSKLKVFLIILLLIIIFGT